MRRTLGSFRLFHYTLAISAPDVFLQFYYCVSGKGGLQGLLTGVNCHGLREDTLGALK